MTPLPPHRAGECTACEGFGRRPECCESDTHEAKSSHEDDLCPDCPECDACEGHGSPFWEWEKEDVRVCRDCETEALQPLAAAYWTTPGLSYVEFAKMRAAACAAMPEVPVCLWGEDGEDPACLAHALKWHALGCGCGLWPKAVEP